MTVLEHERLHESLKQRNHYLSTAVTEARGAVHALREPTFEFVLHRAEDRVPGIAGYLRWRSASGP